MSKITKDSAENCIKEINKLQNYAKTLESNVVAKSLVIYKLRKQVKNHKDRFNKEESEIFHREKAIKELHNKLERNDEEAKEHSAYEEWRRRKICSDS